MTTGRTGRRTLKLGIATILIAFQCFAHVILQSTATLRFKYVNQLGVPVKDAFAEMFKKGEGKASYRTESSPGGDFLISDIEPGEYILRISSPESIELATNITMLASQKRDLGTIQGGGLFDVKADGMIFTAAKPTKIILPCRQKFELLRDSVPEDLMLSTFELEDRAIRIGRPKWPPNTDPNCSVMVYLVVDSHGNVGCAAVDEALMQDSRAKAALSAAVKSKFRPFIRNGLAVPVIGVLEFKK